MITATEAQHAEREFVLTAADFEKIRKLIYQHAGILLAPSKQEMVYSRLARRLRAVNMRRFSDYLAMLEKGDATEWEGFVNALTTNLTSFFREAHHFPVLAAHARARRQAGREPFTVWSCAASTGEEPYSIAMTLLDALGPAVPAASVLATDVDTGVLATAAAGLYDAERVCRLAPEQRRRHFVDGPAAAGGVHRVRDEVRNLVRFRRLNLLDGHWPLSGKFDAIFCRNVMIYFDKPTQRRLLERFAPLLRDDGLLFVGHAESFFDATDLFRLCGKTVYAPVRTNAARR